LIKPNDLGLDMFQLNLVMSAFKLRCGTHLQCETRVINQEPKSMMS